MVRSASGDSSEALAELQPLSVGLPKGVGRGGGGREGGSAGSMMCGQICDRFFFEDCGAVCAALFCSSRGHMKFGTGGRVCMGCCVAAQFADCNVSGSHSHGVGSGGPEQRRFALSQTLQGLVQGNCVDVSNPCPSSHLLLECGPPSMRRADPGPCCSFTRPQATCTGERGHTDWAQRTTLGQAWSVCPSAPSLASVAVKCPPKTSAYLNRMALA